MHFVKHMVHLLVGSQIFVLSIGLYVRRCIDCQLIISFSEYVNANGRLMYIYMYTVLYNKHHLSLYARKTHFT